MAGAVSQSQFPLENILETLEYGSAVDGDSVAKKWLNKHNGVFGNFINGEWYSPDERETTTSNKHSSGEPLATTVEAKLEDVDIAVDAAASAHSSWTDLTPHSRAKFLYSIARNVQKHQSLLAIVEAVDTGKPSKETRSIDLPAVIRQFYHFAGWAQILPQEMRDWSSLGVSAIFPGSQSPLVQLAQRVAPALAGGNTVVLMPSSNTRLSALLFADICALSGLPPGVVNVITGSNIRLLASHLDVDMITLTGRPCEGQAMRQVIAGSGKKLTLELTGHCPLLVFEEADLDSAVECVIDAAFSNSGQNIFSASRLLVQQTIYQAFVNKLKVRMAKITMGDNLDKNNDMGYLSDPETVTKLTWLLMETQGEGAEVFQPRPAPPGSQNSFPPTLVIGAQTSSQIYVEEPCGPVAVVVPFRTVKEGITLANHGIGGTAAGVWTENMSVALEVASQLRVATVWLNSYGLIDAACGAGGSGSSGFGRIGGKESLYGYMYPSWQGQLRTNRPGEGTQKFPEASPAADVLPINSNATDGIGDCAGVDKTYKLFYGGGQKRPDSGASVPVKDCDGKIIAFVPDGGKKDIRNAVEAAVKAAPGWRKKDGHGRSQILYYLAENLSARRSEFITLLSSVYGNEEDRAKQEVDIAVERLFYWAAYCDKYGGAVQESSFYGQTIKKNEALGVIGMVCPSNFPFLGFISLVAPAIAMGNAVVAIPSRICPLPGLAFHQILETSDVPAGVVNIISGDHYVLTRTLAQHQDINSMWYFEQEQSGWTFVETAAASGCMKRTWVNYGEARDWLNSEQGQGEEFLLESVTVKNIWLPMGDIFAN